MSYPAHIPSLECISSLYKVHQLWYVSQKNKCELYVVFLNILGTSCTTVDNDAINVGFLVISLTGCK